MLADCHFTLAQGLPEEEYRFVRRTVIGIILATDMVGHAKLVKVRMAAYCTLILGVHLYVHGYEPHPATRISLLALHFPKCVILNMYSSGI